MPHLTLLLADDDPLRRESIRALCPRALEVRVLSRVSEVVEACRTLAPDAVILGASAAGAPTALRSVDLLHGFAPRLPVLVVVEGGSERLAAGALRAGASDYLPYPLQVSELASSLSRVLDVAAAAGRRAGPSTPGLIGRSREMARVREYLAQVAVGDATVLITGETGTGKELAAAFVHAQSPRRLRPYVSVNCAAIPEALLESELFGHEKGAFTGAGAARVGLLQSAQGGTIFLDEVGDMGMTAQAKILRAIEAREVYRVGGRAPVPLDVRVVAATNRDLEQAVEDGSFRRDLYFRLNVARVHLPALRERRADIGEILDHYLRDLNARAHTARGLAADARCALEAYDWPGNVRELKNLVETLFVCPSSEPIRVADLPDAFRRKLERFCGLEEADRRQLLDALLAAHWNKSQAAQILHCSRMTLYRKMARYAVLAPEQAAAPRRRRRE